MTDPAQLTSVELGTVYRCPVCGAEVSLIRGGTGVLAPICCNVAMEATGRTNPAYFCTECGSEIMVVAGEPDNLEPVCCNKPMSRRLA